MCWKCWGQLLEGGGVLVPGARAESFWPTHIPQHCVYCAVCSICSICSVQCKTIQCLQCEVQCSVQCSALCRVCSAVYHVDCAESLCLTLIPLHCSAVQFKRYAVYCGKVQCVECAGAESFCPTLILHAAAVLCHLESAVCIMCCLKCVIYSVQCALWCLQYGWGGGVQWTISFIRKRGWVYLPTGCKNTLQCF